MEEKTVEDDPVCLVFIPALVAILYRLESEKGSPLTESEVHAIRDKSVCMSMPYSAALAMEQERGCRDVRPEHCWEDWQDAREQLKNN